MLAYRLHDLVRQILIMELASRKVYGNRDSLLAIVLPRAQLTAHLADDPFPDRDN